MGSVLPRQKYSIKFSKSLKDALKLSSLALSLPSYNQLRWVVGHLDKFSILNSSDELKQIYKNIALVDFGGDDLRANLSNLNDQILFIGPEGGFSDRERNLFENKFAFKTNHILRSTSAIIALGAMFLA